jgi:hypothetical protein
MKLQLFSRFFSPNLEVKGRLLRGLLGVGAWVGAWYLRGDVWLCLLCAGSGAFTLFEALRGWCVARACGIKTPL